MVSVDFPNPDGSMRPSREVDIDSCLSDRRMGCSSRGTAQMPPTIIGGTRTAHDTWTSKWGRGFNRSVPATSPERLVPVRLASNRHYCREDASVDSKRNLV
jgi:hypothetical protein